MVSGLVMQSAKVGTDWPPPGLSWGRGGGGFVPWARGWAGGSCGGGVLDAASVARDLSILSIIANNRSSRELDGCAARGRWVLAAGSDSGGGRVMIRCTPRIQIRLGEGGLHFEGHAVFAVDVILAIRNVFDVTERHRIRCRRARVTLCGPQLSLSGKPR